MRHLPPSAGLYRPLPPSTANSRAHAHPHLHPEHVFPGVTLQPQEARVEVPHGPAAVEVGTDAAMRPLRHAAVAPFRVEPRQEETDHAVHAAPRRPDRRFVAGREEDRVGPTSSSRPATKRRSGRRDRKSTRLNSSHSQISYAVFCLKKKKKKFTKNETTRHWSYVM